MQFQMTTQLTVEVPAEQAWHVLAHRFDQIGQWTSLIPLSQPVSDTAAPDEAPVGGRVCSPALAGFRAIRETFTSYDEAGMRFSYAATEGLPWLITRAENHYAVRPLAANRALVESRAEVALRPFPGMLVAPLVRLQLQRAAGRVFEELKYYLEHGQPHPRKLRASGGETQRAT